MSEKKQSANWNIAATHWLTSGFVIPLLLSFIISLILGLFSGEGLENQTNIIAFASMLYLPIVYWLGVMYSARYINKKYFIKNGHEIAKLSTLYLLVVGGGSRVFQIANGSGFTFEHISFILTIIVFYVASKKYIKSSEVIQ